MHAQSFYKQYMSINIVASIVQSHSHIDRNDDLDNEFDNELDMDVCKNESFSTSHDESAYIEVNDTNDRICIYTFPFVQHHVHIFDYKETCTFLNGIATNVQHHIDVVLYCTKNGYNQFDALHINTFFNQLFSNNSSSIHTKQNVTQDSISNSLLSLQQQIQDMGVNQQVCNNIITNISYNLNLNHQYRTNKALCRGLCLCTGNFNDLLPFILNHNPKNRTIMLSKLLNIIKDDYHCEECNSRLECIESYSYCDSCDCYFHTSCIGHYCTICEDPINTIYT